MDLICKDVEASKIFYQKVLKPINVSLLMTLEKETYNVYALGQRTPDLWLIPCDDKQLDFKKLGHLCFKANSKAAVDAFYEAALLAGGTDNGKPGYRDYVDGYYAAYVFDLDGRPIEMLYFDFFTFLYRKFIGLFQRTKKQ
ncbi:hypothetical protein HDV02_004974 [Globomyces sp. JEL0801]|nr:hypothetical protein HDV02_004974 [Globomyces sp. JEL0801]